ncbi:uncharacterized protein si:dkey-195m11.11 isoform X2 [Ictalurus furcatus]|uniref:uncharacterized protein si:dkey-195m11.11 isoform X2 n=1 Tax=Ictalurus furcatus TaxID=66913 RepID=UPI0023506EF4|nr:uncharacterized protein si:dkey-195m11.11 isoform X2 [Ictalurus furcatus]
MGLHKLTVLCSGLCLAVFAVRLAESQELLQAPTLRFAVDVNQSAIKLYSSIVLVCTIPDTARRPAEVHLSLAANTSSAVLSFTLTWQSPVFFTLIARPDYETAFTCWYRHIRTNAQSHFSEPINIVISALSDPLAVLIPPVFPVGTKYTFQCETPLIGYTNTTLSVYDRLLPLRSGNNSFEYVGSRVLAPGEWGAAITRTNAGETYEFLCEMEVFLNGRALRSRSKPIAAMPEELPVRLVPKDLGTCYGDAYVRVRDDWRPLCFVPKFDNTLNVAKVVCKELGCGRVIDYRTLGGAAHTPVGTPNCTGNEKKIAECPISSARSCDQGTLNVICSEALPPPTLSLSERETASRVYVRTEESATLECIFQSSINEFAYITLTRNGNDLYTERTLPGQRVTWILHNTVNEGEYACYVHTRGFKVYRTESSNVIGIYIYDPPPAGAVAAGVITTIIGVIILVLLCIYGASE